jgi:hypothetical protein
MSSRASEPKLISSYLNETQTTIRSGATEKFKSRKKLKVAEVVEVSSSFQA